MSLKSDKTNYGSVAVAIHWVSALLILVVLASGFRAANTPDVAGKAQILSVHVPLAIVVVLLTVARVLWWWLADRKPDPVAGTPRWQHCSTKVVHWLFFVVILGMGASGIGMLVLSGAGPIIFGGADSHLPDFWNFKPRVPHGIGARVMIALLLLHVGAALYHQFIKKDRLLSRMWFSSAQVRK